MDLIFGNDKIGTYYLDFVIEKRIVLELKAVPRLLPIHFRQVSSYLKETGLELGILANFRGDRLVFKRILNGNLLGKDLD